MPEQHAAAGATTVCPVCRNGDSDSPSLFRATGDPLTRRDPSPDPPPADRHADADSARSDFSLPGPLAPWRLPTHTIDFWQGLAAGLAAAVVILFLIALAA